MSRVTILKIALAIAGIGLFLWANDSPDAWIRWVGIGLVAAAWMLRFVEKGKRTRDAEIES